MSRTPTFKVILAGAVGVGKTSIFLRLKDGVFDENKTPSTVGVETTELHLQVDGKAVN